MAVSLFDPPEPRSYEEMAARAPTMEELLFRRGIDVRIPEALDARLKEILEHQAYEAEWQREEHKVRKILIGLCILLPLVLYIGSATLVAEIRRRWKKPAA